MATIPRWKALVDISLINTPALSQTLSVESIEQYCREAGHEWRKSFWSPTTTLITFLLQILDGAKTLRSAVALTMAQIVAGGHEECPSVDPTAYCQARRRLPAALLNRLLQESVAKMRGLVDRDTGWLGRRVWVIDASSVTMPDTPELQKVFPQPCGQKSGCGFPTHIRTHIRTPIKHSTPPPPLLKPREDLT